MPNGLVEGLFLLAFFLPPIAVVIGIALLLAPRAKASQEAAHTHAMPAHR